MINRKESLFLDARERMNSLPAEVLAEVRIIGGRSKLYGPRGLATEIGQDESRVTYEPRSNMDGRLSEVEAIALLLIHNEVRELSRMFSSGRDQDVVRRLLELHPNDMPGDVLRGMADYVRFMSHVAKIREMVADKIQRPRGNKMDDLLIRYWYDRFAQKVVDDGFLLGVGVSSELLAVLGELESRRVITDGDIVRWESYRYGAEVAQGMYVSALEHSCQGEQLAG